MIRQKYLNIFTKPSKVRETHGLLSRYCVTRFSQPFHSLPNVSYNVRVCQCRALVSRVLYVDVHPNAFVLLRRN